MLLFGGIFYAIFAEGTVQSWAEEKINEDSDEKTTLKSWFLHMKLLFYKLKWYLHRIIFDCGMKFGGGSFELIKIRTKFSLGVWAKASQKSISNNMILWVRNEFKTWTRNKWLFLSSCLQTFPYWTLVVMSKMCINNLIMSHTRCFDDGANDQLKIDFEDLSFPLSTQSLSDSDKIQERISKYG